MNTKTKRALRDDWQSNHGYSFIYQHIFITVTILRGQRGVLALALADGQLAALLFALGGRRRGGLEGLFEIGNNVVDMLSTDRDTDEVL